MGNPKIRIFGKTWKSQKASIHPGVIRDIIKYTKIAVNVTKRPEKIESTIRSFLLM